MINFKNFVIRFRLRREVAWLEEKREEGTPFKLGIWFLDYLRKILYILHPLGG